MSSLQNNLINLSQGHFFKIAHVNTFNKTGLPVAFDMSTLQDPMCSFVFGSQARQVSQLGKGVKSKTFEDVFFKTRLKMFLI